MKKLATVLATFAVIITAHATSFTFKPVDTIDGDGNHNDLGDFDHTNAYTWGINSTSTGSSYSTLTSQLAANYYVSSAVLTITNLYNWDSSDSHNQLFIHLLDNPKVGVKAIVDDPYDNGVNQGTLSDYFGGHISTNIVGGKYVAYGYANTAAGAMVSTGATNTYLTQFHDNDGPASVDQYSFAFSNYQRSVLEQYISNGHIDGNGNSGGAGYADFGLGFDPDCHYYNDGIQLVITTAIAPPHPPSVSESGSTLVFLTLGILGLVRCRRNLRG